MPVVWETGRKREIRWKQRTGCFVFLHWTIPSQLKGCFLSSYVSGHGAVKEDIRSQQTRNMQTSPEVLAEK